MPAAPRRRNWPSCSRSRLAYLRALEAEGVALDAARRMIFFRLAADADQFLTIAKFRALRKLWARIEAACGLAPAPAFVSAETAWRMLAARDPQVNILRTTIAVFAAALGGADAITVLPFTAALGLPDRVCAPHRAQHAAHPAGGIASRQSRRPGGGLRRVEDLTDQLCRRGLGVVPGDRSRRRRRRSARERSRSAKRRRRPRRARSGRSPGARTRSPASASSPILDEAEVPGAAPMPARAAVPCRACSSRCRRSASPSRSKRCATHPTGFWRATGARPKIFLANLGTPAEFTRAQPSPGISSRLAASRR